MGSITVVNLGKAYKQYTNRWSRLAEWVIPFSKPRHSLHWVLQDINFSVSPGEAVGIIGINGAGKSTLLKIITGTTQATTGSVHIRGNVVALLELGMGFHPDFTGRQNVLMAGQLLGYSVDRIISLMPEIEAFAEIGDYIDQPLRVYSSGMQMRLAFSLATVHRPDILIVDEALSVGDAYFQHKSFDRIREFRREGTTLLFVSHDKGAVQSICDRAILLNTGKLAKEGDPVAVMDYYNAMLADHQGQTVKQEVMDDGKAQTISGTGEVILVAVALKDATGQVTEMVAVGQAVSICVKAVCKLQVAELVVGYMIKDRFGQPIFGTNTHHHKRTLQNLRANETIEFSFDFQANLGPGTYSVAIALHAADTHIGKNYEWRDRAIVFEITNIDKENFVGVAWIPPIVRGSI
jgi:lipopolysaccharide transport system ATP-binding protein